MKTFIKCLWFSAGLVLSVCCWFIPLWLFFQLLPSEPLDNARKFDKAVWQRQPADAGFGYVYFSDYPDEVQKNIRWEMLEDLQIHHLRIGMTKTEVVALLGEYQSGKYSQEDTLTTTYFLGPGYSYSGYLNIRFDTNDHVEYYRIHLED